MRNHQVFSLSIWFVSAGGVIIFGLVEQSPSTSGHSVGLSTYATHQKSPDCWLFRFDLTGDEVLVSLAPARTEDPEPIDWTFFVRWELKIGYQDWIWIRCPKFIRLHRCTQLAVSGSWPRHFDFLVSCYMKLHQSFILAPAINSKFSYPSIHVSQIMSLYDAFNLTPFASGQVLSVSRAPSTRQLKLHYGFLGLNMRFSLL